VGQPMHAFDKDELHGKVSVRFGRAGEAIELLNGTNLDVTSEHLVIADEDGPIALAGIMGGELSSVTDVTQNIFLEAAVFSQDSVAGKWRSLGFSTDALHRFERGVDPSGSKAALGRLAQLIVDVCGGKIGQLTSVGSDKVEQKPILFRCDRVKRLIGIDVTQDRVLEIFSGLELAVSSSGEDLIVTPPSYRFDLVLEADLIEEIARIEGFDKLPATLPRATSSMLRIAEKMSWPECAQQHFVERSYHEVITYSFVSEDLEEAFGSGRDPVRLANPIAEQYSVMRSSLIGSLVLTLQKNLSHLPDRVRIFEASLCFGENNGVIDQKSVIAGLCYGRRLPEQWSVDDKSVDFYDIKGDVEEFLSGEDISFHRLEDSRLHPGKSASIVIDDVQVGIVGEIHPQLAAAFDIGDGVFVFELQVDKLPRSSSQRFMPYSKYQRVRRDISIEVNSDLEVSDIVEAIESGKIPFLQKVGIFDVYEKAESTDSTKSLAFSISFQDTKKTLTDEEVERSILQIRSLLEDRFGARLRGN
jgi:phenylalanyl-tRNA synthetase beta chain